MQAKASRALTAILFLTVGPAFCGCGGGDESPAVAVAPPPQAPPVDAYRESGEADSTTDPAAEATTEADAGPMDSGGQPLNPDGQAAADVAPPGYEDRGAVPPGYEGRGETPSGAEELAADEDGPQPYRGSMGPPSDAAGAAETPPADATAVEEGPAPYRGSMGPPGTTAESETPTGYEGRGFDGRGYEGRGEMAAGDPGVPAQPAPEDALSAAKAGFGQLFNALTGNTPPQPATLPDGSPNPAAADYHAQLAELLFDAQKPHHELAVLALLEVKPKDVTDKKVRARIAQGYKHVAMETSAHQAEAVRGLVKWGGKFSAPLLITMLEQQASGAEEAIYAGLGQIATPEAAKAVVNRITGGGSSGEASSSGRDAAFGGGGGVSYGAGGSEAAFASLRQMGAVAEAPLLAALPLESPESNQSAIAVLGDIGTKKSVGMLRRASKSENEGVADAALAAAKKVQERIRAEAEDAAEDAKDGKAPATRRAG